MAKFCSRKNSSSPLLKVSYGHVLYVYIPLLINTECFVSLAFRKQAQVLASDTSLHYYSVVRETKCLRQGYIGNIHYMYFRQGNKSDGLNNYVIVSSITNQNKPPVYIALKQDFHIFLNFETNYNLQLDL